MPASPVAIIAGAQLADYHFGHDHPFGPARHQAFLDGVEALDLTSRVDWLEPVMCNRQQLLSFHTEQHIENIIQGSASGEGFLDYGDTPARKGIYEAGATVVGSVLAMIDRIMARHYRRGFIPIAGLHHGYPDHSSGFCVFNDCAIAIHHLRQQHGLGKILYVDIDAHHGDGVFYHFEDDPELYIIDFHEDGRFLYPGTGFAEETGSGDAEGTKFNFPLPPYADDELFAQLWRHVEDMLETIDAEFVIMHCGADSMSGDPITHLQYSTRSFERATRSLCRYADRVCDGRIIGLGGGGYNLDNIFKAWPSVVATLLERAITPPCHKPSRPRRRELPATLNLVNRLRS